MFIGKTCINYHFTRLIKLFTFNYNIFTDKRSALPLVAERWLPLILPRIENRRSQIPAWWHLITKIINDFLNIQYKSKTEQLINQKRYLCIKFDEWDNSTT